MASLPTRLVRRATARARRSLGIAHLDGRLDALERRLNAVAPPLGSGPVYLGDHLAVVGTRWGAKLVVDTRDYLLAPHLLIDGYWEADITSWMQGALKPGDVLVDVGANIGYYTLLGACLVGGSGRVVAVEAHPDLVRLLRRNVAMNGWIDTVSVWHRAAWSEATTLAFNERVRYSANSSVGSVGQAALDRLDDSEAKVEVQAVRVDDLLVGLDRVDVLKIDVEGSEVQALTGLEHTLRANHNMKVMVEWSPGQLGIVGNTADELVDLLAGHGMHFRLFEENLAPIARKRLLQLPYGNVLASR